jgi:predicted anti-sigma-YlaC factor YlaD
VRSYEGTFLAVTVPAGTVTVEAHYWPRTFSEGIALALAALVALALAPFAATYRRLAGTALAAWRRRGGRGQHDPQATSRG